MSKLRDQILNRKNAAEDYLRTKRTLWDKVEKLAHNQLNDAVSGGAKSRVFDPKLMTLALERSFRVMAQLPTGKVRGVSKDDIGASKLKNLIIDKYVIPNANAQFDFLTKLRMVDLYSNIYGNFFVLVDWDIKENGYIGPDIWLLNIRDVFPQVGAVSVNDSDYIITRSWKPRSYFENLKKADGFKNVPLILEKLKDKGGSKQSKEDKEKSEREKAQYPEQVAAKEAGYFEILTQFEKDRWVDFCVDAELEFRDNKNPHNNNELPIECKYSIPLLDDFMGMGDFERGALMQMVVNSIWNLYLDACKMSIFPPTLLNKDSIASMSSIKLEAAAKWLLRGNVQNAAQPLNLTPQGVSTFNNTYQVANAALLNMFGTTDTSVTSQTEAGFGKTPKALNLQAQRENVRDNADRFYMEQFLGNVMKKMVNLISKKQSKGITQRLFKEEIEEIKRSYPEVEESLNQKTGELTIPKSKVGAIFQDYEIVSGSTYAVDQKAQQENLVMLMQMVREAQTPQGNTLMMQLEEDGYTLKFGELFKRIISNSGIQDWDKIVEEKTDEEREESILKQDAEKFMQVLQQFQGEQNLNQVPPEQAGIGQ